MPEVCFDMPTDCPSYKDKIVELMAATTDLLPRAMPTRRDGTGLVLPIEVCREPSEIENYVITKIRSTTARLANRSFPKVRLSGYLPYWELL